MPRPKPAPLRSQQMRDVLLLIILCSDEPRARDGQCGASSPLLKQEHGHWALKTARGLEERKLVKYSGPKQDVWYTTSLGRIIAAGINA